MLNRKKKVLARRPADAAVVAQSDLPVDETQFPNAGFGSAKRTISWEDFTHEISFFFFHRVTSPLCAVIYNICEDFQLDFYAMYACVGLWNTFFLVLFALFDASKLMKWCTR